MNGNLIKYVKKLQKSSFRDSEKKILVEGINAFKQAIKSGLKCNFIFLDKKYEKSLINIKCEKFITDSKTMDNMSSTKTSYGVESVFDMPKMNFNKNKNILFLDEIKDPGNLGTLIRSAVAFGITNIFLSRNSIDPFSPKVIRSSTGYLFRTFIKRDDYDISYYKSSGYHIYGTDLNKKGKDLNKIKTIKPYILILGNEGRGISTNYLHILDENIVLNISNNVDSLNVSVAGSIIMHYLYSNE